MLRVPSTIGTPGKPRMTKPADSKSIHRFSLVYFCISRLFGYKGLVVVAFMLPCVLGAGLLYGLGRTANHRGGLLFAFLFGCLPLIFPRLAANTSGTFSIVSRRALSNCCSQGIPKKHSPYRCVMPAVLLGTSSDRSCSTPTRRPSTIQDTLRYWVSSLRAAFSPCESCRHPCTAGCVADPKQCSHLGILDDE